MSIFSIFHAVCEPSLFRCSWTLGKKSHLDTICALLNVPLRYSQQFVVIHHYKMQFRCWVCRVLNRINGDRWGKKSVPVLVNSTGSGSIFGHWIQAEFWLQTSSALSSDSQVVWNLQFTWGYWILGSQSLIVQMWAVLCQLASVPDSGSQLVQFIPQMIAS